MIKTTTQYAKEHGIGHWVVRAAYDSIRPDGPRIGRVRLIDVAEDGPTLAAEIARRNQRHRHRKQEAASDGQA